MRSGLYHCCWFHPPHSQPPGPPSSHPGTFLFPFSPLTTHVLFPPHWPAPGVPGRPLLLAHHCSLCSGSKAALYGVLLFATSVKYTASLEHESQWLCRLTGLDCQLTWCLSLSHSACPFFICQCLQLIVSADCYLLPTASTSCSPIVMTQGITEGLRGWFIRTKRVAVPWKKSWINCVHCLQWYSCFCTSYGAT